MTEHAFFTVEKHSFKGLGIGNYGIRYTPEPTRNEAGDVTAFGLSFFCLLGTDMLADEETTLAELTVKLNRPAFLQHGPYIANSDHAVLNSRLLDAASHHYEGGGRLETWEILEAFLQGQMTAEETILELEEGEGDL